MIPNASPCARPTASARWDVSDIPGVYIPPKPRKPATTRLRPQRLGGRCESDTDDDRDDERGPDRKQASAPVAQPAERRIDDGLEEPGDEEDGGDRSVDQPRVERERAEDDEHTEEKRRERVQPETADESRVTKRAGDARRDRLRWRAARDRCDAGARECDQRDGHERRARSDDGRHRRTRGRAQRPLPQRRKQSR